MLQTRTRIILTAVFFGVIIWIVDTALDYLIFYEGDFLGLLLFKVPSHEIYIRFLILAFFFIFGLLMANRYEQLKRAQKKNEILIGELQEALNKIKTLRGLVPICSSCKKVRNDKGFWDEVECVLEQHTEADFTHGICPDCSKKVYEEMEKDNRLRKSNPLASTGNKIK